VPCGLRPRPDRGLTRWWVPARSWSPTTIPATARSWRSCSGCAGTRSSWRRRVTRRSSWSRPSRRTWSCHATLGKIGFEGRLDYSAIGSVCNLGARLCGEAKGGQILIPHRVAALMEDLVEAEPVGDLTLKGFHRRVAAYNVVGLRKRTRRARAPGKSS